MKIVALSIVLAAAIALVALEQSTQYHRQCVDTSGVVDVDTCKKDGQ